MANVKGEPRKASEVKPSLLVYLGEVNLGWLVILSYLVSFDLGFVPAIALFVLLCLRIDQSCVGSFMYKRIRNQAQSHKVCEKEMAEKCICSQTIAIPSGPLHATDPNRSFGKSRFPDETNIQNL